MENKTFEEEKKITLEDALAELNKKSEEVVKLSEEINRELAEIISKYL